MLVRHCDRCGKPCGKELAINSDNWNAVVRVRMRPNSSDNFWYDAEDITNLCADCRYKLEKWLEGNEHD